MMHPLLTMIQKRARVMWAGWVVAGVALAAIPVTNQLTLQTAMGQMRFVAMDSRNTFYLTSVGKFYDAQAIRKVMAKIAAVAIFTRRPDGFEHPELIDQIFWPVAGKVVLDEAAKEADTFKVEQVHQHCETGPMTEISKDSDSALVSVEVQIMREYLFNQRVLNDVKQATLFFAPESEPGYGNQRAVSTGGL